MSYSVIVDHRLAPGGVDDVSGRELQPREMNWRVGLKDCVDNNEIGQWTRWITFIVGSSNLALREDGKSGVDKMLAKPLLCFPAC